jgi:hypothetical protein
MTGTLAARGGSCCPGRPRQINRWMRQVSRTLGADHRDSVRRVGTDLVATACEVLTAAAGSGSGPGCTVDLVFAGPVGLHLTQCHRDTAASLERMATRHGLVLARLRHHGGFWSLDFLLGDERLEVLTRDVVIVEGAGAQAGGS